MVIICYSVFVAEATLNFEGVPIEWLLDLLLTKVMLFHLLHFLFVTCAILFNVSTFLLNKGGQ